MSESILTVSESLLPVPQSAGHASFHSFDHSDPLYPLQLDACVDWNADTGATSHMTPHHHWLHNYVPQCIPIKLADNNTVYSAGEGIVYFNPIIDGKAARTFGFIRVLHVPDLRNNLLSVLFLTRQKGFTCSKQSITPWVHSQLHFIFSTVKTVYSTLSSQSVAQRATRGELSNYRTSFW